MHTVETVLLVLLLGALTGIAAQYIRTVPLPLIQIALGALLSWPRHGLHIDFDPELFLLLFIPPLLFADGWRIPKREFFALHQPILRLAFGLVLFTVIGLGYLIHWLLPQIPLSVAFALAAVISPTDAVAVSAITRRLGMPSQTMHVLEGESLLNDASGLVALKFAIAATLTGAFSVTTAIGEFIWIALGGLATGALIGGGFATARDRLTRRLGDMAATQTVLLLILLPFAAYIVGERIGVSGILAAVAAGITTNFADLNRTDFIAERLQTDGLWKVVEAAFNGAIFLLLGVQLPDIIRVTLQSSSIEWWQLAGYVLQITLALLVLRWVWLTLGVRRSFHRAHAEGRLSDKPSRLLILATTLAGIRGAITLAGALSVPLLLTDGTPFPSRDLLVFLAAGVIITTLVIGSIGLPLVLRRLPPSGEPHSAAEERRARITACHSAIASMVLDRDAAEEADPHWLAQHQEVVGRLTQEYRRRIEALEDTAAADPGTATFDSPELVRARRERYVTELELRIRTLNVERRTLYAERRAHRINDESLRALVSELDLTEVALRRRLNVARNALQREIGAPPPAGGDAGDGAA